MITDEGLFRAAREIANGLAAVGNGLFWVALATGSGLFLIGALLHTVNQ